MIMLILYLIIALCDNIEISTSEFHEIHINNRILHAKDIVGFNSVKLSFPGTAILKLKEIRPKIFELYDSSVYYYKQDEDVFKNVIVDYEKKVYIVALFVYKFIFFAVIVALFSAFIIQKSLKNAFSSLFFAHPMKF